MRNLQLLDRPLGVLRRHLHIILDRIQHGSLLHDQIRHVSKKIRQFGDGLRNLRDFSVPASDRGFVGVSLPLGLRQVCI